MQVMRINGEREHEKAQVLHGKPNKGKNHSYQRRQEQIHYEYLRLHTQSLLNTCNYFHRNPALVF